MPQPSCHLNMRKRKKCKYVRSSQNHVHINSSELYNDASKDNNFCGHWEVVVAQLVERSLLIPEVSGSTTVIGKILLNIFC